MTLALDICGGAHVRDVALLKTKLGSEDDFAMYCVRGLLACHLPAVSKTSSLVAGHSDNVYPTVRISRNTEN